MCSDNKKLYAELILPLAIQNFYTYIIPDEIKQDVKIGSRVVVQFGKSKLYSAVVNKIFTDFNQQINLKSILQVLDDNPIINQKQIDLWKWISQYYFCTVGEVYRAALPSGLKLESKSVLIPKNYETEDLSSKEKLIADYIFNNQKKVSIDDVNKFLNQKSSLSFIKKLNEKNIIEIEETITNVYKPKEIDFVKLNFSIDDNEYVNKIFSELKRAKKQLSALLKIIDYFNENKITELAKNKCIEVSQESANIINQLIKKDILVAHKKSISRINIQKDKLQKIKTLTQEQQQAYDEIKSHFENNKPVLLHGITSSGKTEIYIKLIRDVLKQNKQVLYLLPEISLSTQIISRLINVFGNKIGVYHSKYPDNQKVELWKDLLNDNQKKIIIGARSSVFLPFTNLGLIIVDEEHDRSYKQQDPAPRYNARDISLVMSNIYKSNIILGSATPSIESFYNVQIKKYAKVELKQRFGSVKPPEIKLADLKKAYRNKQMISVFTPMLYNAIKETLAKKEQIILFQNRRGFSSVVECAECGWVPKCKRCDVGLTYHKYYNSLRCHYCGYSQKLPKKCPACGNSFLQTKGLGTEKIEDEIKILFPDVVVERMDLDTARTQKDYDRIINSFQQQQTDILVGTQMVSKGFDFDNVGLIGVINADNMMHFADFRANEHIFQLITQVSGRAGRRKKQGKVIIQTFDLGNKILRQIVKNDYDKFYNTEINERRMFNYPPFYKLIEITIKNKDYKKLNKFSDELARSLFNKFDFVLGPAPPPISRINNFYLKKILIKIQKSEKTNIVENKINTVIENLKKTNLLHSSRVIINRDPV